jgi:oxalate decarboxylase/phosphoglucose isomerase-like protein (cupin superfamily)
VPIDAERLGFIASGKSSYEEWRDAQGIPVVTGFHIPDLKQVPVQPWDRKGVKGTFLDLEGTGDTNDAYILEIPSGGSTSPARQMFEELIYVLDGRGSTTVEVPGGSPISFEWGAGALFAIPLNCGYRHFNASGEHSARMIAVTSAPVVINLFHNLDFVFNCPFEFTDRFSGASDFFKGDGRSLPGRVWDTNLVPDVLSLPLLTWDERGKGSTNRMIELADSSMCAHVSEFPVGSYKKAHRHGPGAHVIIIGGEGYTLMWREGEEPQKFDWTTGSLVVPPNMWFHQHFNGGATPAKYLALRWNSAKYKVFADTGIADDVKNGGNQIESRDEDPRVRAQFESLLAAKGVSVRA